MSRNGPSSPEGLSKAIGSRGTYTDPIKEAQDRIKKIEAFNLDQRMLTEKTIEKYRKAELKKANKEQKDALLEVQKKYGTIAQKFSATIKDAFLNIGNTVNKIVGQFNNGINAYIKTYNEYLSSVTTRLQGTNLDANKIARNISANLGTSPFLKQDAMMNNLNKFVESGIAYNLELRSFIATATDKIAITFNAFDSSLLRLIRIQQADTTVARLGMESLLTKFLNAQYKDTSYLSSIGTGNISSQLLEAESLMGYQKGSEFDYAVQRWLGSMSSLGVSSNTINSLAQGLGYLGSGNISALSGNTGLQNLLVMASGGQYGNLLTGGLTARGASDLLTNIVRFGQSIANSGNNVVRSELASLFGMTVSDLVSLTNITAEDIKEITKGIVEYEELRQETTNQLATMSKRTTAAEMVSNVLANMKTSLSANVASSPAALAVWTIADLMTSSGLDIEIPLPLMGGSLSTANLMKLGVVGYGGLTSLINAASALGNGNLAGTSISAWSNDVTTRGNTLAAMGLASGVTTSTSTYMGGYDEGAVQNSFDQNASNAAEYTGTKEEDDIAKILKDDIKEDLKSILFILQQWDIDRLSPRI